MKTVYVRCEPFTKIDKNGKSRSVVSAAAYIAGTKMSDDLAKKKYDYTQKKEVVASKMFWPTQEEKKFFENNPEKFFNVLQESDRKKDGSTKLNSRLAKKYVLAIPNELSINAAKKLMDLMAEEFKMDFFVAIGAIHWQPNNHHIHFLVSDKVFENGSFKKKNPGKRGYMLDEAGQKIPLIDPRTGQQKTRIKKKNGKEYIEKCWKRQKTSRWTDSKDFLQQFKIRFESEANRLLTEEGFETQISTKPEADKEPEIHIGAAAWQMHRKGLYSSRYEQNERIKMRNHSKTKAPKPVAIYKPTEAEKVGLEILRDISKGLSEREILAKFSAQLATGGEKAHSRLAEASNQISRGKLCLPVPREFVTPRGELDVSKIKANPQKFAKSISKLAAKKDAEMIGGMAAALVPIPGIKSIIQKAVSEVAESVLKTSYAQGQGTGHSAGQGQKTLKDIITGEKDSHAQLIATTSKATETDDWFWLSEFERDEKREEMARKRTY